MARLEHNETYILLRVLQIICAVIVTGQAICIVATSSATQVPDQIRLFIIFTIVLGASSTLKPIFWLFFQKLNERFPKLTWVELGVDFQFGLAWFLMFIMLMMSSVKEQTPNQHSNSLSAIIQTFMLINGVLWQASGVLNVRQIWQQRQKQAPGDRRALLDEEHEFANRSLRSKPSTSSTMHSSPVNYNNMPAEPVPSVTHWRPISPVYDLEGRRLADGSMNGRAI